MTQKELRDALGTILEEESRTEIDWSYVRGLCLDVIGRLNTESEPNFPHDVVYHFLDDPDVRQKDDQYGQMQRARLREWLASDS